MSAALGLIFGPSMGGFLYHHVGFTCSLLILSSLNILVFILCKFNFGDLKPQSIKQLF